MEVWPLDLKNKEIRQMNKCLFFLQCHIIRKAFSTITIVVEKQDTYPFLKGPALADFMFIVVEHFLPNLDHLVAHVLDLCHSLHKDTQKPMVSAVM